MFLIICGKIAIIITVCAVLAWFGSTYLHDPLEKVMSKPLNKE